MTSVEYYRSALRAAIDGRRLIITGGALRQQVVRNARELGALAVFALDGDAGVLGVDAAAKFTDLSWRAAMDEFDPDRSALVLGSNFQQSSTFAGRRFVGARRPEWCRWEDKTEVPALWQHAGIDVAEMEVVPATCDELWDAARRLDAGLGTVWAGDHRDGEGHSGADLRWIRDRHQAEAAANDFAVRCDHVRVMAYVEGQPCSIHGIVTENGAAVLRPVAQRITRDDAGTFAYDGCDLDWRPPVAVAATMRSAARRVARSLRTTTDYLGVFTLDGIAAGDDFVPTEVNTRFGAALTALSRRAPRFALRLLHSFIADGDPTDWRPHDLEDLLLTVFD